MAKLIAIFNIIPVITPIPVPMPAFVATRKPCCCSTSPTKAPITGPRINPGKPKNNPTTVPILAPRMAFLLAPPIFAPKSPAMMSIPCAKTVNIANPTSIDEPMYSKPSNHAAYHNPPRISIGPGITGKMAPAIPNNNKNKNQQPINNANNHCFSLSSLDFIN